MAEQDNMQNGENAKRQNMGMNGGDSWDMRGSVQGNGMSPMMMSRMQGGESEGANGASRQIRNAQTEMERADVLKAAGAPKEGAPTA